MKPNELLKCAPNLEIRIRSDRDVRIKFTGEPALLCDRRALAVCEAFASPATLQAALARLLVKKSSQQEFLDITRLITKMHSAGYLVDAQSTAGSDHRGGFEASPVHIRMLNDQARTRKFQQAIKKQVTSKDIVLDIGTGTGVLAVTAALCGAKHVFAIEQGAMAEVAEKVIHANGIADRVTLMRGFSKGIDLPYRANVLVSEILGNDPLAEAILPVTRDAIKRLLTPDPVIIPGKVDVFAIVYDVPTRHLGKNHFQNSQMDQWQDWYGIDFSPLMAWEEGKDRHFGMNTYQMRSWQALCEPIKLCSVDFYDRTNPIDTKIKCSAKNQMAIASGRATGILIYFDAHLGADINLSIHPDEATPANSWASHVCVPCAPVELKRGGRFDLTYTFDGQRSNIQMCTA